MPRLLIMLVAAVSLAATLLWLWAGRGDVELVDVQFPVELSPLAAAGQPAFVANCASCHGGTAGGTEQGPPLVHQLYEPGHHPDAAFLVAVRAGVRAHHWGFGSMFPIEGVSDMDLERIIAFVRELQRANGIF